MSSIQNCFPARWWRLRLSCWRGGWLSLLLLVGQVLTPGQGHAMPNPIEGALGGGRVATGAAPAGVVSAGGYHTCGIQSDGTLACWGDNSFGQLDNVPTGAFTQVSAGDLHTCGVQSDGTLACWGDNTYGKAPVLTLAPSTVPDGQVGSAYSQTFTVSAANYTPPTPQFTLTGDTLPDGVTFTVDQLSGTPTAGGSFALTVRGEDSNGFTATQTYTWTVITDTTPPVITPTVNGTLGTNEWYTSDVSVSWSVVDNESTVTTKIGCGDQTVSSDTTGTTFTCKATSAGGTAEKSVTIKRDATAPTVTCPTPPPVFVLKGAGGNVSANVTDATSGPLTSPVSAAVNVATAGAKTVSLTGTDNAGNTTKVSCGYLVSYKFLGFLAPLPKASYQLGSTIPVKFRLGDATGALIPDTEAQSLASACRVKVGLDSAPNCASYDVKNHFFQFDLKIPKTTATGGHQIVAQVLAADKTTVLNTNTLAVTISK